MRTIKKIGAILLLLAGLKAHAQTATAQDLQQLILDMEKLTQLKSILSDMKSGYQIYNQGYGAISAISKGSFDLHSVYLHGLLSISPAVQHYSKVADIILEQASLIKEYRSAYVNFRRSKSFSVSELNYMSSVYTGLVNQSLQDLDELSNILTTGKLRMSDAERLKAIDRIEASCSEKLAFLRRFNNQGIMLSLQRSKDLNDSHSLKQLYNITK
jgi:hypothetical protein